MSDVLARFPPDQLIGLVAVIGAFVCGALGILLGFYYQSHQSHKDQETLALKREMINRGMSVEEIQAVLEAGTKTHKGS